MAPVIRRAVGFLAALDERRFPQFVSISLGGIGAILGLLFLFLPGRVLAMPALSVLLGLAGPVVWGSLLLALGTSLATAAVVNYERSHFLSGSLSVVLFTFSLLAGLGILEGAAGIVAVLALGFAWLLLLSAVAGVAPRMKALL